MKKIFLFLTLMSALSVSHIAAFIDKKTKQKKTKKTEQKTDMCDDGFLLRIVKKYPKMSVACIVIPVAALAYQNYCLIEENQTHNILNRQLAAIKQSLEEQLAQAKEQLEICRKMLSEKLDIKAMLNVLKELTERK